MANSLLADLLKTPSQVREEQMQKLRAEGLQRAGLLQAPTGARTALPSIYTNIARSGIASAGENVANIARLGSQGLGGMLGAAGYEQAGQALAQATVTPEERQAAQAQSVLRGVNMNDPESLLKAAQQLQERGLTGASAQLVSMASQIRQTQAELQKTQQQALTEVSKQAKNYADLNYTSEQIVTEIQKRNPEIDAIEAQRQADIALTNKRKEETKRISQLLPGELSQQQADLRETQVKTDEINSQISLNRERLASLSQTDFLKELEASDLSDAEKKELINERVQTRARTGGVSGTGNKIIEMKLKSFGDVIDTGRTAEKGLRLADQAISILPDANLGIFRTPAAYVNRLFADMGISDDATRATVANQLIDVVSGRLTLAEASQLKGALSDKDLAFLQQAAPRGELTAATLQKMFTDLYMERYAEKKTAEKFDSILSATSDSQLRAFNTEEKRNKYMELYRLEAKVDLSDRFAQQ